MCIRDSNGLFIGLRNLIDRAVSYTHLDVYKRQELKQHAEKKKLIFLSTPFSNAAVALLRRIGLNAWKIGSGETNNLLMLEEIASLGEPVLLSSGMSYIEELDRSVDLLLSLIHI